MRRIVWMDVFRGSAVILVIVEHAIVLPLSQVPSVLLAFAAALSPFRMPALMFLSGLLLERSLAKPPLVFLLGKVDQVLWPYVLWSVVFVVMSIPGAPAPNVLQQLLVDPTSPTWFLGYLFIFYCLGLVVAPRFRWALIVIALILAAILAPSGPTLIAFGPASPLQRFLCLLAVFLAGSLVGRSGIDLVAVGRRLPIRLLALMALVVMGWMTALGVSVRFEPLFIAPVIAVIVACVPLSQSVGRFALGRGAALAGRHSIVFFVLHWPAQVVVVRLVPITGWWQCSALVCVGLLVPIVFVVIRKRLPVLRFLFDLGLRRRVVPRAVGKDDSGRVSA